MVSATKKTVRLKAKLFRGLADSSRLSILEALREGPTSVGEIAEVTELRPVERQQPPSLSGRLRLVRGERDGRYVYYQLSDARVAGLIGLAEELLTDVARGVYACTRYDEEDA